MPFSPRSFKPPDPLPSQPPRAASRKVFSEQSGSAGMPRPALSGKRRVGQGESSPMSRFLDAALLGDLTTDSDLIRIGTDRHGWETGKEA